MATRQTPLPGYINTFRSREKQVRLEAVDQYNGTNRILPACSFLRGLNRLGEVDRLLFPLTLISVSSGASGCPGAGCLAANFMKMKQALLWLTFFLTLSPAFSQEAKRADEI